MCEIVKVLPLSTAVTLSLVTVTIVTAAAEEEVRGWRRAGLWRGARDNATPRAVTYLL